MMEKAYRVAGERIFDLKDELSGKAAQASSGITYLSPEDDEGWGEDPEEKVFHFSNDGTLNKGAFVRVSGCRGIVEIKGKSEGDIIGALSKIETLTGYKLEEQNEPIRDLEIRIANSEEGSYIGNFTGTVLHNVRGLKIGQSVHIIGFNNANHQRRFEISLLDIVGKEAGLGKYERTGDETQLKYSIRR